MGRKQTGKVASVPVDATTIANIIHFYSDEATIEQKLSFLMSETRAMRAQRLDKTINPLKYYPEKWSCSLQCNYSTVHYEQFHDYLRHCNTEIHSFAERRDLQGTIL